MSTPDVPAQPSKPFWQSRTVIANALLIIAAILDLADVLQLSFMSQEMWLFIGGVVNIFLRFISGQSITVTNKATP